MKRVLSIDFDFFQIVSHETILRCYPDGVDLPSFITEATWTSHYASHEEEIMQIQTNKKQLKDLMKIIAAQSPDVKIQITQSHRHAYKFIKENISTDEPCEIINIDMHHDMYNHKYEIDCGNWLSHIDSEYPNAHITWVENPESKNAYGTDIYNTKPIDIKQDFAFMKDMKFDMIFLCRSDSWLPPHLDPEFHKLKEFIENRFKNTQIEIQVDTPRDMNGIMKNAEDMREWLENLIKNKKEVKKS